MIVRRPAAGIGCTESWNDHPSCIEFSFRLTLIATRLCIGNRNNDDVQALYVGELFPGLVDLAR
jgi:hypothetical protein